MNASTVHESEWAIQINQKRLDEKGQEIREARYLKAIWPQAGEIHDLHFGPLGGTFFNAAKPLTLEDRFAQTKST